MVFQGQRSDKEIVEQLGSELEKKEKDDKMDSKAPDYYYRIVEEARKRHECSGLIGDERR
jgi:hemerythrin superfamily protein